MEGVPLFCPLMIAGENDECDQASGDGGVVAGIDEWS
jgi:hypothetical protein